MRTRSTRAATAVLGVVASLGLANHTAAAGEPPQHPDKAVVAFLDGLYQNIAASHPNPEVTRGKGLYKPPPLANNDRTRDEYHVAAGLAEILGYDFVKLAVIEEYQYRFKMRDLIAELPNGSAAVARAREVADLLWLCTYPNKLSLHEREADVLERTDAYLARVIPAKAATAERGRLVLGAFVRACTFGIPDSTLAKIRPPLGESALFARSVAFAKVTGLPFGDIAKVELGGGPLVMYGLARALPRGFPGRDESLAALRSDKEWTYPPK